jgi:hypothetical protein
VAELQIHWRGTVPMSEVQSVLYDEAPDGLRLSLVMVTQLNRTSKFLHAVAGRTASLSGSLGTPAAAG